MAREAGVYYDKSKMGWVTTALGAERVDKNGKPYRLKVVNRDIGPPSKRDQANRKLAEAWLAEGLRKIAEAPVVIETGGMPTVATAVERYIEDCEESGRLGKEALDSATACLKRLMEHTVGPTDRRLMGALPLDALKPEHMDWFLATAEEKGGLKKKGAARATLITLAGAVRTLCNWATRVRRGRYPGLALPLAANPIARFKAPPSIRRAHRPVEPAQVDALLAWYDARTFKMGRRRQTPLPKSAPPRKPPAGGLPGGLHQRFAAIGGVFLRVLRATGARPKELCTARWADWTVRPDGYGIIELDKGRWKNGRKTGKERIVVVPPVEAQLVEWIKGLEGRHETAIFVRRRDRTTAGGRGEACKAGVPHVEDYRKGDTKQLQKWFYRVKHQAIREGVPIPVEFRLYWFRSVFSTEAQRRNLPMGVLAKGLGTSEAMLERHYSDHDVEDMVGIARGMAGGQ